VQGDRERRERQQESAQSQSVDINTADAWMPARVSSPAAAGLTTATTDTADMDLERSDSNDVNDATIVYRDGVPTDRTITS